MADDVRSKEQMPARFAFLRVPLFRLLAINLAAGIAVAARLVGGLLVLNPFGLRDLIFADNSPGTALGLLLFGFVVTSGSAAMGTAIMAVGRPLGRTKLRAGRRGWWRRSCGGLSRRQVSSASVRPAELLRRDPRERADL